MLYIVFLIVARKLNVLTLSFKKCIELNYQIRLVTCKKKRYIIFSNFFSMLCYVMSTNFKFLENTSVFRRSCTDLFATWMNLSFFRKIKTDKPSAMASRTVTKWPDVQFVHEIHEMNSAGILLMLIWSWWCHHILKKQAYW